MRRATQRRPPEASVYRPYGAALELMMRRDPEILIAGSAGTGKSRAALEKLFIVANNYPGMRALMARKTRASMTQSTMVTWERKVLPVSGEVKFSVTDQEYRFPNGSVIVVGGMDNASRIMSTEYDMAYLPESTELTEDDYEMVTTRLRNGIMPYQQLIADCNPDRPTHWIKKRADRGALVMLNSRHEDNPSVTADYIAKLDALTGVRKLRLRYGMWAAAEGMVYEGWDSAVHMLDTRQLVERGIFLSEEESRLHPTRPKGVVAGVDWGYTHPGVIQVWALDNDLRMYLVREIVQTKRTIDWWVEQAVNLEHEFNIQTFACDPSRPDAITAFNNAGLNAVRAYNPIPAGIQLVQQRLKILGDGRPRLYVYRDALASRDPDLDEAKKPIGFSEEVDSYIWSMTANKRRGEEPVMENDDSADATRYAVALVDRGNLAGSEDEIVDLLTEYRGN